MPLLLAGTLGSAHGLVRVVAFLLHPLLATNHTRRDLPESRFQSLPRALLLASRFLLLDAIASEWLVGGFERLDFRSVLGCPNSR
jgi:hypothetical protein